MTPLGSVEILGKKLALQSIPPARDVASSSRLFVRYWVMRISSPFEVGTGDLESDSLTKLVKDALERAYGGALKPGVDVAIRLQALDRHHIVAEIECPKPTETVGDEAAIITWTVLRECDSRWEIEDLQGVPKRYWLELKPVE